MLRTFKAALLGASILGACASGAMAAPVKFVGVPAAGSPVHFDVVLPLRDRAGLEALLVKQQDPTSGEYHHWLTPTTFGMRFGPDSATIGRAAMWLQARGFAVKVNTRSLHVTGPASLVESAFGTKLALAQAEQPGHNHVVLAGALHMPAELAATGAQIFSFSPHMMHPASKLVGKVSSSRVDNRYGPAVAYWFDDLRQAYSYPAYGSTITTKAGTVPLDGTGTTIAALMSSDILPADITALFEHEQWSSITGAADPALYATVDIDGGGGTGGSAFAEASIDTQSELGSAPGAKVVLYSIPTLSDGDIFNGYVTIVEQDAVDLVSSSFGECELFYFPSYNGGQDYRGVLAAEHEIYMQGNSEGISFLASSGDSAGRECPSIQYLEGKKALTVPSVSVPAADTNVTAVGGTNLVTAYSEGSLDSSYVSENAWDDPEYPGDIYGTGGELFRRSFGAGSGYSRYFTQPAYQTMVDTGSTTARAVPDIGAHVGGCPEGAIVDHSKTAPCNGGNNPMNGNGDNQRTAGVFSLFAGTSNAGFYGFVGTSLSSPQMAGISAMIVQRYGRMGNLNNYIYKLAAEQAKNPKFAFFHTDIPGYNGVEETLLNSAYSLSVGVGTPIVANFIGQRSAPRAGVPQTASNP